MKRADFNLLLEGVREAGAYLRELKKAELLAGSLGTGRTPISVKRMNAGAKSAIARAGRKGLVTSNR
jgi:hypothetical protein